MGLLSLIRGPYYWRPLVFVHSRSPYTRPVALLLSASFDPLGLLLVVLFRVFDVEAATFGHIASFLLTRAAASGPEEHLCSCSWSHFLLFFVIRVTAVSEPFVFRPYWLLLARLKPVWLDLVQRYRSCVYCICVFVAQSPVFIRFEIFTDWRRKDHTSNRLLGSLEQGNFVEAYHLVYFGHCD